LAEPQQDQRRREARGPHACQHLVRKQAVEPLLPRTAAQLIAHRAREGDQAEHEGPRIDVAARQCQRMPRQIARFHQHDAPEFARLPVTVVARIDAKAEEDRQGHPHQRKRRGGQRDLNVEELAVREHHRAGQQQHEELLREDARQQGAAANEEQVNPVRTRTDDHDGQARGGAQRRGF